MTSATGGLLLVLAVMLPFVGVLAGFALGGRAVKWVAAATIAAGIVNAAAAALAFSRAESGLVYLLGGWSPPLGIALRADGLTIVMMLAVAAVILGIAVYARSSFTTPAGTPEARAPLVFWTLMLAIWGSLSHIFVWVLGTGWPGFRKNPSIIYENKTFPVDAPWGLRETNF